MLTERIEAFCSEIIDSELYRCFTHAKKALCEDEELCRRVSKYKSLAAEFNKDGNYSFDEEKHLSRIYWELMQNQKALAYFEAEKSLVDFLSRLYGTLAEHFNPSLFMR